MKGARSVRIGTRERRNDGHGQEDRSNLIWGLATQQTRMELEKPKEDAREEAYMLMRCIGLDASSIEQKITELVK